jgi:hypothetical protein
MRIGHVPIITIVCLAGAALGIAQSVPPPENELHKLEVNLTPSLGKKGHDYVVVAKSGFYVH